MQPNFLPKLWMLSQVSEGLDFADANARCVVILGLPFPNAMDPQVPPCSLPFPCLAGWAAAQSVRQGSPSCPPQHSALVLVAGQSEEGVQQQLPWAQPAAW